MEEIIERLKAIPTSYFVVGALALAGLYYWMYFDEGGSIAQKIDAQGKELAAARQILSDTEAVIGDKQKFEQEYNTVSDQFRAAIEYLPSTFSIQSLLKQIYNEARSAGIELEKTTPKPATSPASAAAGAVTKQFYEELQIEVTLIGSYPQLTLFLSYISRLQRIVNIRNVVIKYDKMTDAVPMLSMTGTLVSYKYLEGR
ncbi:MAG: type 4a pilus biogenesis protein PilO [Bdellovibrionia bacterium]